MNGIHDLGGMHGFGPVVREEDEALFHADWERRVFGLLMAALDLGLFNVDESRHANERMAPADYLAASYYEIWLDGIELLLIERGLVTEEELSARRDEPEASLAPSGVDFVGAPTLLSPNADPVWFDCRRDAQMTEPPRFRAGEGVRTRNTHVPGHTRLPRYGRAKRGTIDRLHGAFILPDAHAHGGGEAPQYVYSVRFEGQDLWGKIPSRREAVYIDLWESYLAPLAAGPGDP